MKRIQLLLLAFLFGIISCTDKPMGESDDPSVELEKLVFDKLYSTNEKPKSADQLTFESPAARWNGSLHAKDDAIYLWLEQPAEFELPMDPDAPDTLPSKVNTIEIYIAIADEEGNLLSEKSTTSELRSSNRFVYEMPPMTFRNLSTGKHKLKAKARYILKGKGGSNVGEALAEWSWEMPYFMPKIYKSIVSFDEFRLSDATYAKSKENNDGLGNPLPDLFWNFSVNNQENFKSSTYENSNPYLVEKLTFNIYHLEEDPTVTLQIYDDDYTSFNDKIASWSGKLASFRADEYVNVPIKGLDFFKIKTSIPIIINQP
jgi:hypothetical protein